MSSEQFFVSEAKAIARQWVQDHLAPTDGFRGAFFHGSINDLPDDARLSPSSDVDVMAIFDEPPPLKLGKFRHADLLLEVSYLAADDVRSAEQILSQYHLTHSFRTNSIISDPFGQLAPIQAAVAQNFAKREWISARCKQAHDKVLNNLAGLDPTAPFHMQVMAWLFATGAMTHVLLVADLQNPTVRTRYVAAQKLLARIGRLDVHEKLLALQGSDGLSSEQVAEFMAPLTEVFDAAKGVVKTPIFFATDISDLARPIAIDGSWALIDAGYHREAIFWIVATYTRCLQILMVDGPELHEAFSPQFAEMMAMLGIHSFEDICERRAEVEAFMPSLWRVAMES